VGQGGLNRSGGGDGDGGDGGDGGGDGGRMRYMLNW
jgi:hypothetical protein